jgi:hypothetical protein
VRRAGADGSEEAIRVHVEALPGAAGQLERLQVDVAPEAYVGFAVRAFDLDAGRWVMLYANSTRSSVARLEGTVTPSEITWNSVTPGRERESRMVWEHLADGAWRRTQHVSEDRGQTWRVLFVDELERDEILPNPDRQPWRAPG